MISALLPKIGFPLLVAGGGFIGGLAFQAKVLQPKPADPCPPPPACVCNPPAVSVQPFDVEKIKGLKSFQYAPQFSGTITVAGVDSVFVKKAINDAVVESFEKFVVPADKKKRR